MITKAKARGFFTRSSTIVVLCLLAVIRTYAQEPEYGAYPVWSSGEFEAQIRIEIFNDYQCPPCAVMNDELKKVLAKYPRKVRFYFRNFPLPMHTNALAAAKAADAAGMQGKFRNMIDFLYSRVESWSNERDPTNIFVTFAKELGLDVDRFTADMTSENVANRIDLDIKRAKFLGVKGTPTLFMNGRQILTNDQNNLLEIVGKAF